MSRLIDADALKQALVEFMDAFIDSDGDMMYSDHLLIDADYLALCDYIDKQPTVHPEPHWIPVEQALPELRHDVLLTVFFHERWNVAEGYRQDGEFMFWNNGILESVLDEENRVIAWMPKPEPFKGVNT